MRGSGGTARQAPGGEFRQRRAEKGAAAGICAARARIAGVRRRALQQTRILHKTARRPLRKRKSGAHPRRARGGRSAYPRQQPPLHPGDRRRHTRRPRDRTAPERSRRDVPQADGRSPRAVQRGHDHLSISLEHARRTGSRADERGAYPRSLRRSRRQSRLYLRALSLLRSRGVRTASPPRRTHTRVREAYARGQYHRALAGRDAARAGVRRGFRFCARRRAVQLPRHLPQTPRCAAPKEPFGHIRALRAATGIARARRVVSQKRRGPRLLDLHAHKRGE